MCADILATGGPCGRNNARETVTSELNGETLSPPPAPASKPVFLTSSSTHKAPSPPVSPPIPSRKCNAPRHTKRIGGRPKAVSASAPTARASASRAIVSVPHHLIVVAASCHGLSMNGALLATELRRRKDILRQAACKKCPGLRMTLLGAQVKPDQGCNPTAATQASIRLLPFRPSPRRRNLSGRVLVGLSWRLPVIGGLSLV